MLASVGEITDPCGVPVFVSDHLPSSITPALSHFWISRRIRGSATRCSTNLISQLLSRYRKILECRRPERSSPSSAEAHTTAHPALDAGYAPDEIHTRSRENLPRKSG